MKTLKAPYPIAAVGLALLSAFTFGQVRIMPGHPNEGELVLKDKGCLSCHAIEGRGGSRAPDFATPTGEVNKPGLLAAKMWNHIPSMFAEFEAEKRPIPKITAQESANLYSYFYASLFFAPKGDAARGRSVFQDKRCISCHGDLLDPNAPKSRIGQWTESGDPIVFAERMWNHSNEMLAATSNRGIPWPRLSERDVVDLLLFLSKTPNSKLSDATFNVGDPGLGRVVFDRSCSNCHSFGTDRPKVDLLTRAAPTSMTGYIADMWNHAPEMRAQGGNTVKLESGDMSNLIAYLFSQRFFFEAGDIKRGQKVYEAKNCITCHELRRQEMRAPDLTKATEAYSPITLTASAWSHGPDMLRSMRQQKISWPEFEKSEMADLIAFLNSRILKQIAH